MTAKEQAARNEEAEVTHHFVSEQTPDQLVNTLFRISCSEKAVYMFGWTFIAGLLLTNSILIGLSKEGMDLVDRRLIQINSNLENVIAKCQLAEMVYHERASLESNQILGGKGIWNISLGEHLQQRRQFAATCKRLIQSAVPPNVSENDVTQDDD